MYIYLDLIIINEKKLTSLPLDSALSLFPVKYRTTFAFEFIFFSYCNILYRLVTGTICKCIDLPHSHSSDCFKQTETTKTQHAKTAQHCNMLLLFTGVNLATIKTQSFWIISLSDIYIILLTYKIVNG